MRKNVWSIAVAVTLLILLTALTGCPNDSDPEKHTVRNRSGSATRLTGGPTGTGTAVTVKSASDYETEYPDVYKTYQANSKNFENYNYPDKYTFLQTVYQGMAFSFSYNSARGHVFSLDDLYTTGRPHAGANCFACKTPDFHALVNQHGYGQYNVTFPPPDGSPPVYGPNAVYSGTGMKNNITNPISCFNCHGTSPANKNITVTHQYLSEALPLNEFNSVSKGTIACAQCHVEYYFGTAGEDPKNGNVILPYTKLAEMHPDSILDYYNDSAIKVTGNTGNAEFLNGDMFADYLNPRTGVRQIKIQHPEFETQNGTGNRHGINGSETLYACADCHMPSKKGSDGNLFASHEWGSPLKNDALIRGECAACHTGNTKLPKYVEDLQKAIHDRAENIGKAIETFTNSFATKLNASGPTDTKLQDTAYATVRQLAREAQFYWDFVWVENSNGAHNSKLSKYCLDKAEELLADANTELGKL